MAETGGVTLNIEAINEILRAAQPMLDARGRRMAAAAGEGFEYVASPHKWTARGFVQTSSARGRRREALEKVLLRSISAGGG